MDRATFAQRVAGILVAILGAAGLVTAQGGGACQTTPGKCQGAVAIAWAPHLIVGLACQQNCTPQCGYGTSSDGFQYCHCVADGDFNGNGIVDSVLCNVGWQVEPGGGVLTRCVTDAIACTAPLECKIDIAVAGGVTTIRCCCK